MRKSCLIALAAAAGLSMSSLAAAQPFECCPRPAPTIVYGAPRAPVMLPPTGYVLDPSDARAPIYVVNQGPVYSGPNIVAAPLYTAPLVRLAVPTYSEGGYAYAQPYPYVRSYWGWPHPRKRYWDPSYRPYGAPPYGAYRYRPAPSARIINLPEEVVWTSLSR
jgi:hypothetical protein